MRLYAAELLKLRTLRGTWGFVVVGIETNTIYDQPASRGNQLLAALNWAVNSSPTAVRSHVDGSRRGGVP